MLFATFRVAVLTGRGPSNLICGWSSGPKSFFGLSVYVFSPFGLAGPYSVGQGEAQGDIWEWGC